MSHRLKIAIFLVAFSCSSVGCSDLPDKNAVERVVIGSGDNFGQSDDRSYNIELRSNKNLIISRNGVPLYYFSGAIYRPSIVNIVDDGRVVVIENGYGSGQLSKISVYIDGKLNPGILLKARSSLLEDKNCNLSEEFIDEKLLDFQDKKLIISLALLDRYGECQDVKKKVFDIEI